MTKTILITGASRGIGKATALLFNKKGWNVVATMRTPEDFKNIPESDNMVCTYLDVTNTLSIRNAIKDTIMRFGSIDVLINNAGYGLIGLFEATTKEQIQKIFTTNVFGVMEVIRIVLPFFREQGYGTIINISSIAGKVTFPFYSFYDSTKWAIEGFSEALQYELKHLNIKVKIIEPGIIKTDFYNRALIQAGNSAINGYSSLITNFISMSIKIAMALSSSPESTAKVIYKAAVDGSWRLRYPAGGHARGILFLRRVLSDRIINTIIQKTILNDSKFLSILFKKYIS